MASLFLILSVFAVIGSDVSTGYTVGLTWRADVDAALCGEHLGTQWVRRRADGSVWLNGAKTELSDLAEQLHRNLLSRHDKLVIVSADADVPFNDVLELVDISRQHAEHVALLSLSLARGRGCLYVGPRFRPPPLPSPQLPKIDVDWYPYWRLW